ncbi:MAG TPA: hypothetical protein VFE47_04885 [Tepidisphaeraceae bacterium]|nr:hypothetical protein [Tepidisphaeraceae bacterium]
MTIQRHPAEICAKAIFICAIACFGLLASPRNLTAQSCAPQTPAEPVRKISFTEKQALAAWTLTGDAALDPAKSHDGKGGALKIGPGAKAVLKLRDEDASGKVEMWVYDDGTVPANPKAGRVGPRWGLAQSDGKLLEAGILYAAYLGGNEGYTATAYHGASWFDELFWLGANRAPAGWHKFTFDFDAESGLQILHNDKPTNPIDAGKAGLKGFNSIIIQGDDGKGNEQTIWVADITVTLGGPTKLAGHREANPYDAKSIAADPAVNRHAIVYTRSNAPQTPALDALPLKGSVSEYGMTWTFDKPAHVGQFINGDWYVVGAVTIVQIDPKPLHGAEIPKGQLDHMDNERPADQRVRNGFMLNPPAAMKVSYDSGVRNYFDPSLIQKLPVAMTPGDSLVSSISMPKGLELNAPLRNKIERGVEDSSPIETAAVLTCVAEPQPADAFRPAFCDRTQKIYLARNLHRELLPTAAAAKSIPDILQYVRFTQRPWVGTCFFGFEEPVENMPSYGLEYGRVSGMCALLLCTDLIAEKKEVLLDNYVQVGIDLGGMIRAGHPGWYCWGGHGSGRKLPIVFAGILLGDEQLANIHTSFPNTCFGEDEQTAYGTSWTGAKVVFTGHSGIDEVTGVGRNKGRGEPWGPYEHTPPAQWKGGQITSESYRRCCTSIGWVAEALALRLMHAEKTWNHDAFFDYVDRWMEEDDSAFVKEIKAKTGKDFSADWARQGQCWDDFANDMWKLHRGKLGATDGWKTAHDETYYKTAIEKD